MQEELKVRSRSGILFPDKRSFAEGLPEVISLLPQHDELGRVRYLLGKGTGLELTVQGQVRGRSRRLSEVSFRPHTDLELYACDGNPYAATPLFHEVLGGQEFFPTMKKSGEGAEFISRQELIDRHEVVFFGGREYLVPELESQFVDKYLGAGTHHRPEGKDAMVLAAAYQLNVSRIDELFERHIASRKRAIENETSTTKQVSALSRNMSQRVARGMSLLEGHADLDNTIGNFDNRAIVFGIAPLVWSVIQAGDFDASGQLLTEAHPKVEQALTKRIEQRRAPYDFLLHRVHEVLVDAGELAAKKAFEAPATVGVAARSLSKGTLTD